MYFFLVHQIIHRQLVIFHSKFLSRNRIHTDDTLLGVYGLFFVCHGATSAVWFYRRLRGRRCIRLVGRAGLRSNATKKKHSDDINIRADLCSV